MLNRRHLLTLFGLAGLAACADPSGGAGNAGLGAPAAHLPAAFAPAGSQLRRNGVDPRALPSAVTALSGLSTDLYRQLAISSRQNLVCSPFSVAQALAMLVQGAAGPTAAQILQVLHAGTDPRSGTTAVAAVARGLGSLDLAEQARNRQVTGPDGSPEHVHLATANAVWGQQGLPWRQPFLDALARDFGAAVRQVDYRTAVEPARAQINAWVSQQTRTRIPQLIPTGVLDASTRLVLANALYLKAPWAARFPTGNTEPQPFTRADGRTVTVPMMNQVTQGHGRTAPVDDPHPGVPAGDADGPGHAAGVRPGWRGLLRDDPAGTPARCGRAARGIHRR